jgi:hypothetical protein
MGNAFDTLNDEQKKNFEKRLQELGLNSSHVVKELKTGATPGPTYLSTHPDVESAIPPQKLTFKSLSELKQIGGIPDDHYQLGAIEEHHDLPPSWPEEKDHLTPDDLSPEENQNIRQAFMVQMYGPSHKVKSYEQIINKHHFPLEVGAFAVQEVVVDADHPLILKGPQHAYNFGVVTIKPGGQIQCEAHVDMTVQKMIKEN